MAFTAELLGKTVQVQNGTPIDQAVSEVMEVVRPWHKGGAPETLKEEEEKLHRIFIGAVQLAKILPRQRALWSVRLPCALGWGPGAPGPAQLLRFNPIAMEDERNNDDINIEDLNIRYVEFIVAPALYKQGTMNSERFDREEAVCRSAVVIAGLNRGAYIYIVDCIVKCTTLGVWIRGV